MKTFVQQGISVRTTIIKWVNGDYKAVKVDDLNKMTQQKFTSKEQNASQGTTDGDQSEATVGDKFEANDGDESEASKVLMVKNLNLPMTRKGEP
uniref:Uncharacterized protein n=1 Tax=Solanum tuberosum TaxID=4113 RepID=M1DVE6_SOLTU